MSKSPMSAIEHAARYSSDVLSEAIQKYLREKVAKKIRKRKENGWEEVHREMKTVAQNIELSEAIQNLSPNLREMILKEYIAIKIKEKNEMGWMDDHEEIENLPYCETQGQITKVFVCLKFNTCKVPGLCVACYENETCLKCKICKATGMCLGCFENKTKYHTLVGREEAYQLEIKGFARIWGAPKRISESKQEIKKREEDIRLLRIARTIARLSNEYLEQKAAKKIRKRKENGWDEVHREMIENS